MTPEFDAALQSRDELKLIIYAIQISLACIGVLSACCIRHFFLKIIVLFLVIPISVCASNFVFDKWWANLVCLARTQSDRSWIFDHDGGRVIFYFTTVMQSAILFLFAIGVSYILHRKAKAYESKH